MEDYCDKMNLIKKKNIEAPQASEGEEYEYDEEEYDEEVDKQ